MAQSHTRAVRRRCMRALRSGHASHSTIGNASTASCAVRRPSWPSAISASSVAPTTPQASSARRRDALRDAEASGKGGQAGNARGGASGFCPAACAAAPSAPMAARCIRGACGYRDIPHGTYSPSGAQTGSPALPGNSQPLLCRKGTSAPWSDSADGPPSCLLSHSHGWPCRPPLPRGNINRSSISKWSAWPSGTEHAHRPRPALRDALDRQQGLSVQGDRPQGRLAPRQRLRGPRPGCSAR